MARFLGLAILAAMAVAGTVVLARAGSDDVSRVRLVVPTADGVSVGSDVKVAGTAVGSVESVQLDDRDRVIIVLGVDASKVTLGKDAGVAIRAANLLGQKFVHLDPGDPSDPLPDGATIPSSRVQFPVDLDEVLGVLDANTRARLAILIDEAGLAFTGRRADFNAMLRALPGSLDRARRLVGDLSADNRALARLIERGDGWIGRFTRERRQLSSLVSSAGGTMTTFAARAPELRAVLARAPGTLGSGRRFLGELEDTTVPLAPAAHLLQRVSPRLSEVLDGLPAFTESARPALREAESVAPALIDLAEVTPVLRAAVPTSRSLARATSAARPVTKAVGASSQDLLTFVEGWARATQTRDAAGHLFRGGPKFNSELLASLPCRVGGACQSRPSARAGRPGSAPGKSGRNTPERRADERPRLPPPTPREPQLRDLQELVPPRVDRSMDVTERLLDFLLEP